MGPGGYFVDFGAATSGIAPTLQPHQNTPGMNHSLIDHTNTKSFYNMAWIAFVLAAVGTLAGIVLLAADLATKGFLAMGFVFTVSACFTLAKVVRDKHEADRLYNKVERAKTEKFLSETENPGSDF